MALLSSFPRLAHVACRRCRYFDHAEGSPYFIGIIVSVMILTIYSAALHSSDSLSQSNIRSLALCRQRVGSLWSELYIYASEHGGAYPAHLDELLAGGDIRGPDLFCPAKGKNDPAARYMYFGDGLSVGADPSYLLITEDLHNHAGGGCHVLYADGSIAFLSPKLAEALASKLAQTQSPKTPKNLSFPAGRAKITIKL